MASRDHVKVGVQEGFAQACHGKCAPLSRTREGDGFIYYSPKQKITDKVSTCRKFTAIGTVVKSTPYQVNVTESFHPHRIDIDFNPSAKEVSWDAVKDKLTVASKLRFGFVELSEAEFTAISDLMLA